MPSHTRSEIAGCGASPVSLSPGGGVVALLSNRKCFESKLLVNTSLRRGLNTPHFRWAGTGGDSGRYDMKLDLLKAPQPERVRRVIKTEQ